MDNEIKPKKRTRHPDRATLSAQSLEKLNLWKTQIFETLKPIRPTYSDLVNLLIESSHEKLSPKFMKLASQKLHDEVGFARLIFKEVSAASKRGENLSVTEILSRLQAKKVTSNDPPRKKETKKTPNSSEPTQTPSGVPANTTKPV